MLLSIETTSRATIVLTALTTLGLPAARHDGLLDPILRCLALQTRGVASFPGCHVQLLVKQQGEMKCVEPAGADPIVLLTRLVVGADDRSSPLATIAGVKVGSTRHTCFGASAAHRGVRVQEGSTTAVPFRPRIH